MTTHRPAVFSALAANAHEHDAERRKMVLLTSAVAGVAAIATAVPFVSTFSPSERARAAGASVEADISDILPGGIKTVEWRGKPVWVLRRTPEMLATLPGLDKWVFVLTWVAHRLRCPPGPTTPAWVTTGKVVFSAPAMAPFLMWRAEFTKTYRPPATWKFRPTSTSATANC
jgi:hypothetical protein